MSGEIKVRTIKVDDLWEKFDKKCKENGTNKSIVLRHFMLTYVNGTETNHSNLPPNWLEERTRELVREELPPSLAILRDSINARVDSQIARLESELAEVKQLRQAKEILPTGQEPCLNINVTENYEGSGNDRQQTELPEPPVNREEPSNPKTPQKNKISNQKQSTSITGKLGDTPEFPIDGLSGVMGDRQIAEAIGVNRTTPLRWRKRWSRIEDEVLERLRGWEPNADGKWEKAT